MATAASVEHRLSMSLTVEPAELGALRRDIATHLDGWGLEAFTDDVVLVVAELLANVYEHAEGVCDLEIEPVADQLFVRVSDAVMAPPTMHRRSGSAEAGRGLLLVDALTEYWETAITGSGKVVICTFRTAGQPDRKG